MTDTPSLSELARKLDRLATLSIYDGRGTSCIAVDLETELRDIVSTLSRLSGNGGGAGASPLEEGPQTFVVRCAYDRIPVVDVVFVHPSGSHDVYNIRVDCVSREQKVGGAATPSASLEEEETK